MPYGQLQVDTVKDSLNNTFAPASSVFKNRIINGAMVIDQRNAGAAISAIGYPVDRFYISPSTAGAWTAQRTTNAPTGFINSLTFTKTTGNAPSAAEYNYIQQAIEGYNIADLGFGTANAKTVTLSFWVYSGATGTFGGSLRNAVATQAYPFTYTVSATNTWTQIAITIPGCTTGTWATDNSAGLYVFFDLGSGTSARATAGSWAGGNYIGATGSSTYPTSTSGGSISFTGVQLEVGTNATNFEYRPYGTELALCQRYYYQFIGPTSGTNYVGIVSGLMLTTTVARTTLIHKVPMRTAPTITPSASTTISAQAGVTASNNASLVAYTGNESALLDWTLGVAGVAGQGAVLFCTSNTAYLTLSAEL
jgi:hypothetical protein